MMIAFSIDSGGDRLFPKPLLGYSAIVTISLYINNPLWGHTCRPRTLPLYQCNGLWNRL